MLLPDQDTIAAISTPPGTGGLAVVRISGPQALESIKPYFSAFEKLTPRRAVFGRLVHKDLSEGDFDDCVVTFFKAPHSVTGEDLVEISIHGGAFLQERLLTVLLQSPSVRPAGAGEFTLRSFLNGKIDLSRAEAVADLIHAKDAAAHRNARHQLGGGLKNLVNAIADGLKRCLVVIEAELDFSDQEIEFIDPLTLLPDLQGLQQLTTSVIDTYFYGRHLEEGFRIPIIGSPNSGKSSLFNLLLGLDRAIVTNQPGTTRDTIEKSMEIADHTVMLVDTAGLREADDETELAGVDRSKEEIALADLVIVVQAPDTENIKPEIPRDVKQILVYNKLDLDQSPPENKDVYLSCATKTGLEELKTQLYSHVVNMSSGGVQGVVLSNARHFDVFQRFAGLLAASTDAIKNGAGPEYIASDLRMALDALGEITGETTPDDILNQIFSGFCVGK